MTMQLREGRSYAREFVEVPGAFRRTLADAIETLISVLDQLEADPELEDGGDGEPTAGWSPGEIENDSWSHAVDEAEDGADAEPSGDEGEPDLGWPEAGGGMIGTAVYFDPSEDNLTVPETSGGFVRVADSNAEEMALREGFDPRLARRIAPGTRGYHSPGIPAFPHETVQRERFYVDDEIARLKVQLVRITP